MAGFHPFNGNWIGSIRIRLIYDGHKWCIMNERRGWAEESAQMLIITATAEYKKSVKALLPEITPSFYDIQIINLSQIRDYTRGHKIEY